MHAVAIRTSILVALCLSAASARAEEVKIGVVDLRRAVAETEEGRRVTAELKKLFAAKQKELDEQQEALKKAVEDLEKKRSLMSADAVRQKEAELQGKAQTMRQMYERNQEELGRKQGDALKGLIERVQRIVDTIAAAEAFTVVLDRSQPGGVVYARPHIDITNEVIRRFNAGAKPAKPAAPPKK